MKGRLVTMTYHHDLNQVHSDGNLAHLLSDETACAPFDRLEWWQGLVEHCGLTPLLVEAAHKDRRAVLALQAPRRGHAQALANWYTFRFRPVTNAPDLRENPDLLEDIARALPALARRVTLHGVPDEDGSASLIESAFRTAGWLVRREACDTNHYLSLNGRTFEQYLAARPGALRTTLKRKSGKVEAEVLTRFDPAIWTAYEEIYAESWKPAEGSPAFLRAFAQAEGAAGRLRLGVARIDGEAVAAQMWTVERGTAFIHKLAHRDSARALSPGSVLSAAMFAHAIDRDRVAVIDFGTGDDPYKQDWMEQARPRYRLDMYRPFVAQNWLAMAILSLRHLARRFKRG